MPKLAMPTPHDKDFDTTGPGATDIGGYIYSGKTLCSRCTRDIVVPLYRIADTRASTETILNEAAAGVGINRFDERSFTSAEFPHVIYATDVIKGFDNCYVCSRPL